MQLPRVKCGMGSDPLLQVNRGSTLALRRPTLILCFGGRSLVGTVVPSSVVQMCLDCPEIGVLPHPVVGCGRYKFTAVGKGTVPHRLCNTFFLPTLECSR